MSGAFEAGGVVSSKSRRGLEQNRRVLAVVGRFVGYLEIDICPTYQGSKAGPEAKG